MLIDQKRKRRNYAKSHRLQGEAIGEKRGEINAKRAIVKRLIKQGHGDDRKIAYLAGVDESFVRKQRRLLSHSI